MIEPLEQRAPQLNWCRYVDVSFALSGKQLPADHGYLVYSAISKSVSSLHGIDWLAIELISGFPSGRGLIALPATQGSALRSGGGATLRLRIPADHYRDVLPLAGKRLDVGGHQIRLGLPFARPLEPAPSLYARVVTIKNHTEAETFLEAVKRKLDQFGIKGRVELPLSEPAAVAGGQTTISLRSEPNSKLESQNSKLDIVPELETQNSKLAARYRRRIVTIHGKSVVGFSVAVHDLNDEDSLLLQAGAVKVVSPDDGATQWQTIFSRRAMGCGIFNPATKESEVKCRNKVLSIGGRYG